MEQHSWLGYYGVTPPGLQWPKDTGSGAMEPVSEETIELRVSRTVGFALHEDIDITDFTQTPSSFDFAIELDADGVDVSFTDGQRRRYDLVIGADGLYSKVRETVFPSAPTPRYSGQAVWRAVLPRPPEIQTATMWMGPRVKPGVNPVSKTEMYLFVTEPRPSNEHVDPATFATRLRALLEDFPAPVLKAIREQIGPDSQIVFRPLEGLLMPRPWSKGRVVLIGDTVHATTPHLASGACIGIEDALVLAEELGRTGDVGRALNAFENRRWERCRMVVENSARLGEIEVAGGDKEEHARIMRESLMALAQPI